jgi:hypothetical protein
MPSRGESADELGAIAHSTFKDLMTAWTHPERPELSELLPDRQKVDWTQSVPSYSQHPRLQFDWQIKARRSVRMVTSQFLEARCYRLDLTERYIADLRTRTGPGKYFFLVLAIPVESSASLADLPPSERFNFYCVDLGQFFAYAGKCTLKAIDVPVQNRLSLPLWSLIWSGCWVREFLRPLANVPIEVPQRIQLLHRSFSTDLKKVGATASSLLDATDSDLRILEERLGRDSYQKYAGALALVGSLRAVTASIASRGGIAEILNYCPESLAGTVNLWLFSRTYHEFMTTSATVGLLNTRLFPVQHSLESLPRFFVAALFHARTLYRALKVEVKVVKMLEVNGGSDFSWYGGSLVEFPWITIDPASHEMSLNRSRLSSNAYDLDVIKVAQQDVLADKGVLPGWFGPCSLADLRLEIKMPICLFPPEDHLLRHPAELWDLSARSARL